MLCSLCCILTNICFPPRSEPWNVFAQCDIVMQLSHTSVPSFNFSSFILAKFLVLCYLIPPLRPNLSIWYWSLLGDAAFPIRPLLGLMSWTWIDERPAPISLLNPAHHRLWAGLLCGAQLGPDWNIAHPVTLTLDIIICAWHRPVINLFFFQWRTPTAIYEFKDEITSTGGEKKQQIAD